MDGWSRRLCCATSEKAKFALRPTLFSLRLSFTFYVFFSRRILSVHTHTLHRVLLAQPAEREREILASQIDIERLL